MTVDSTCMKCGRVISYSEFYYRFCRGFLGNSSSKKFIILICKGT